MSNKVKVGVLFGGKATEHEVSVISGIQAIKNMDQDKYQAVPIYITKEGLFYTGEVLLHVNNYKNLNDLLKKATQITLVKEKTQVMLYKVPFGFSKKPVDSVHLFLPVTHGNLGENGSLQGYLELLDMPYIGSSVAGSAIAMDKVLTKYVLKSLNIPVVDYVDFYKYDWLENEEAILDQIERTLRYPVIVKPANGGSSIGVTKAKTNEELRDAIELAITMDERLIVEHMIVALREINCSVVGDIEEAEVSLLEEPIANSEILSFEDKYMGNQIKGMVSARRDIPAQITKEQQELIEKISLKVFKALGCSGVVRIDYIIDHNSGQVYFNEMNSIPGSLSFYLWEPKGIPYKVLLDQLIKNAMKRYKRKADLSYTFNNDLFQLNKLDGIKK